MTPDAVMIFAAGRGRRMGALTRSRPKPLVRVGGIALIDHALALADDAGIRHKVVNVHYLGEMLVTHLRGRSDVTVIEEIPEALETGGGLKNALGVLGAGAVFTLNADAVWTGPNPFAALAREWARKRERDRIEALLMLLPLDRARAHGGKGDFAIDRAGRLSRWQGDVHGPDSAAYVNTGLQIIDPAALARIDARSFSLNRVWDDMIARKTLFGTTRSGGWVDVGSPRGVAEAERMLREECDDA